MNFTTVRDGQTRVDIKIYEGEHEQPETLVYILRLEIPPALRGTPLVCRDIYIFQLGK
jgi:molecular chaperone DnaK (HSP70)